MSSSTYIIASISNAGGAPEQAYRKLQSAGACPERPFAGESLLIFRFLLLFFQDADG
jgi:hypothetical protein